LTCTELFLCGTDCVKITWIKIHAEYDSQDSDEDLQKYYC